jgi:hypothetical protein
MANEFKHKDPGSSLTSAEFIASDGTGHIVDSQATGDILYASSSTVLKALPKGSNGDVLSLAAGIPDWTTSAASATVASTVVVVDGTDTSSFVAIFDSATGSLAIKTDTGITYNAGTGMLTVTGLTGPLTGNASGLSATLAVTSGGTGATTLNNLITLATHTTGNYVATVADTGAGGILVTGSAGENVAVTIQFNITGLTTDTIASGDFIAFSDEDEANDVSNKLTVDNLMETGLPLVTEDTVAVATDYMVFLDGGATGNTNKESIADFVSGIAGTNITASGGQLSASGGGVPNAFFFS